MTSTTALRAGALLLLVACTTSPPPAPPVEARSVASAPAPAPEAEALQVLVLEPHLVPSELAFEWSPPRPWTKSGAAIVESDLGVWRIDPVKHTEEILVRQDEPERHLRIVGSGGGLAVFESWSWAEPPVPSKLIVIDLEAGTSRELVLEPNESPQAVSADGQRVLSLLPSQHLDGDPFGESKLPSTLRVRTLADLKLVKEWRAGSGVRFTQPGLSRMAFSRDGAFVFLPGALRDELHSVERGAVVWNAKAYGDSRAEFGSDFVAVSAPNAVWLVDLATARAQKIPADCEDKYSNDSTDRVDVEQKLLVRDCERGVLLADWSGPKPLVSRVKGAVDGMIGPGGAVSMLKGETLWLRTSRGAPMHAAGPDETALLRKVGAAELRRGADYVLHDQTCMMQERTVGCEVQLSPDGTRAYEAGAGSIRFFDPAAKGAERTWAHQLAAPPVFEGRPLRVEVEARGESLTAGDLAFAVHPPLAHAEAVTTPLRVPDPNTAYPNVAFQVGGLDLYHEPGRMVAQTMWAAPTGKKQPTLRLLFGVGFALVWDAHNHVQVAGDRENAAHWLRCVRNEGARLQILPFTACQKQVETTLL